MMVHGEFPRCGAGFQRLLQPGRLAFRRQVAIEHEKLGIAVAEGVRAFRLDAFRAVFREIEHLQVQTGVAALILVVADGGDDRATIVNAPCVVKEAVPVVPFVATIHEVAGHDVKRCVGPLAERVVNKAAPALEPILRVAHVHEGERLRPARRGGELGHLRPAIVGAVADGVQVGRVRLEAGEGGRVPVGDRVVQQVGILHPERRGLGPLGPGRLEPVIG